jgi:hypothetical protein
LGVTGDILGVTADNLGVTADILGVTGTVEVKLCRVAGMLRCQRAYHGIMVYLHICVIPSGSQGRRCQHQNQMSL